MNIRSEFAGDFRPADAQKLGPLETVAGRNDEAARIEAAFDRGRRVNLQRAMGDDLANETPFDDRLADQRIGIEDVAFFFDNQASVSAKVFRNRLCDLIVAQVHMAAAAFAHGGLGGGRDVQFGSALETTDAPQLDGWLRGFGNFRGRPGLFFFFETKVGAASFANRGIGALRLLLDVAALGTRRLNGF